MGVPPAHGARTRIGMRGLRSLALPVTLSLSFVFGFISLSPSPLPLPSLSPPPSLSRSHPRGARGDRSAHRGREGRGEEDFEKRGEKEGVATEEQGSPTQFFAERKSWLLCSPQSPNAPVSVAIGHHCWQQQPLLSRGCRACARGPLQCPRGHRGSTRGT